MRDLPDDQIEQPDEDRQQPPYEGDDYALARSIAHDYFGGAPEDHLSVHEQELRRILLQMVGAEPAISDRVQAVFAIESEEERTSAMETAIGSVWAAMEEAEHDGS
jgi:hypothetical protein